MSVDPVVLEQLKQMWHDSTEEERKELLERLREVRDLKAQQLEIIASRHIVLFAP